MPSTSPQFAAALSILRSLRAEGYQAYLAGGCVRDMLLGREPKDFDIATSATPDIVLDLFPRTFAVGAHFGVVLVSSEIDNQPTLTEVATFRSDGAYSDGRHPDAVRYTQTPEEDVQRRDFTINGLLLDPDPTLAGTLGSSAKSSPDSAQESFVAGHDFAACGKTRIETLCNNGTPSAGPQTFENMSWALAPAANRDSANLSPKRAIIDHVGGLADLNSGIIRAIGDPTLRFEEDHLRMLRAIRFAARFGFQIYPETANAIRALAPKIQSVSRERVRDELTRMLTEGHARRAFELLDETNLLPHVLPEVAKLKGVQQPPQYHPEGDVWTHTLLLLAQLEAGCPMTLAWGALLHDIGKPATYQAPTGSGDRIRFNGHVEVGVSIGAEICRRLRFSNDETTQILTLIQNHMRFADTPRMKASTLKRFFRLNRFEEHLALHKMDCRASSLDLTGHLENYNFAKQAWESMPAEQVRPIPLITGRELIALGYLPGPIFKTILHTIDEAQLEGTITTPEEALALIRTQFKM